MTGFGLERDGNRWQLPLVGCAVGQCCVDWGVTLRFLHPNGAFELRIEQPFVFAPAGAAEMPLRPEADPAGLGPLLACTRTVVDTAKAFEDGRLEVSFEDGSSLRVDGSSEYEPWGLVGPEGLRVVSVPGSRLAIWQPENDAPPLD